MASIEVDQRTASQLATLAAQHGVTIDEYLRMVVERENVSARTPMVPGDFEAELDALVFDGPSLPADFSRADIYADHD